MAALWTDSHSTALGETRTRRDSDGRADSPNRMVGRVGGVVTGRQGRVLQARDPEEPGPAGRRLEEPGPAGRRLREHRPQRPCAATCSAGHRRRRRRPRRRGRGPRVSLPERAHGGRLATGPPANFGAVAATCRICIARWAPGAGTARRSRFPRIQAFHIVDSFQHVTKMARIVLQPSNERRRGSRRPWQDDTEPTRGETS